MRKLTEGHFDPYLQRKLSLAGEMKTSIKRFLDINHECQQMEPSEITMRLFDKRIKEMKKAMENYLNCESEDVDTNT